MYSMISLISNHSWRRALVTWTGREILRQFLGLPLYTQWENVRIGASYLLSMTPLASHELSEHQVATHWRRNQITYTHIASLEKSYLQIRQRISSNGWSRTGLTFVEETSFWTSWLIVHMFLFLISYQDPKAERSSEANTCSTQVVTPQ